jgi:hypothetical protein
MATFYSITDPKTASSVVAHVGSLDITAREFLLSSEFGPAFPKREHDSRKVYLEFMTYEKLLALDGYARGLDRLPQVREALAEIGADLMTEELFRDDVLPGDHVTDAEVEQGAQQGLVSLSLRWLYAPGSGEIIRLQRLLKSGVSFDSLYRTQQPDSAAAERSLETTRFKLRQANPAIAGMVDTLRAGIPSAPVKGPDGWYVVQLDNAAREMVPTETQITTLRYDVRRALYQEKADSLSDVYVKRLMMARKPVIIRTTFNALAELLGRRLLTPASYDEWGLAKYRQGGDPPRSDTLVTMQGRKPLFVDDFTRWYRARETAIRFVRTSARAYFSSLEEFIWRMVRDRMLTERAVGRHEEKKESVTAQKRWWEEKILYNLTRSAIAESIAVSDSALQLFYKENRRLYVTAPGDTLTYEKAKEEVRKDVFDKEFTSRLLHRILALKRRYPVTTDTEFLRTLPVSSENDPKAIDVYTVRRGGILPRPAFPSIDYDWQAWR